MIVLNEQLWVGVAEEGAGVALLCHHRCFSRPNAGGWTGCHQHLHDGPGHIVSRSAPHCLVSLLGQCSHYDFYLSSYPLIFLVPCDNTTHNLHHQIASDRGCGFIIIMHFLNIHI